MEVTAARPEDIPYKRSLVPGTTVKYGSSFAKIKFLTHTTCLIEFFVSNELKIRPVRWSRLYTLPAEDPTAM